MCAGQLRQNLLKGGYSLGQNKMYAGIRIEKALNSRLGLAKTVYRAVYHAMAFVLVHNSIRDRACIPMGDVSVLATARTNVRTNQGCQVLEHALSRRTRYISLKKFIEKAS